MTRKIKLLIVNWKFFTCFSIGNFHIHVYAAFKNYNQYLTKNNNRPPVYYMSSLITVRANCHQRSIHKPNSWYGRYLKTCAITSKSMRNIMVKWYMKTRHFSMNFKFNLMPVQYLVFWEPNSSNRRKSELHRIDCWRNCVNRVADLLLLVFFFQCCVRYWIWKTSLNLDEINTKTIKLRNYVRC